MEVSANDNGFADELRAALAAMPTPLEASWAPSASDLLAGLCAHMARENTDIQGLGDFVKVIGCCKHPELVAACFETGTWPGAGELRAAPFSVTLGVVWTAQLLARSAAAHIRFARISPADTAHRASDSARVQF